MFLSGQQRPRLKGQGPRVPKIFGTPYTYAQTV